MIFCYKWVFSQLEVWQRRSWRVTWSYQLQGQEGVDNATVLKHWSLHAGFWLSKQSTYVGIFFLVNHLLTPQIYLVRIYFSFLNLVQSPETCPVHLVTNWRVRNKVCVCVCVSQQHKQDSLTSESTCMCVWTCTCMKLRYYSALLSWLQAHTAFFFSSILSLSTEEVAVTTRPHIYNCRSPNMEVFTCWWHPLDNLTDDEQVTYVLTYSKECVYTTYTQTHTHFTTLSIVLMYLCWQFRRKWRLFSPLYIHVVSLLTVIKCNHCMTTINIENIYS